MRSIAFAIIALIVVLTLQPCREVRASSPAGSVAAPSIAQASSADDCEDGDDCSPFCICSCCSHMVSYHVPGAFFNVLPVAEPAPRVVALYQESYPRPFNNTVWQPPKY